MLSIRTLALAMLLTLTAPTAFAQTAQPAIEKQMSPEEFKAAGLDKLDAAELAHLNTWLGRTIDTQAAKAAVDAKQMAGSPGHRMFDFGAQEPINSRIPGPFVGFGKGRRYTLENGQVWQQVDDATLAGVRLTDPEARIKANLMGNAWYLSVGKYNTQARVKRIK